MIYLFTTPLTIAIHVVPLTRCYLVSLSKFEKLFCIFFTKLETETYPKMCEGEIDYTLVIDFDRCTVEDLEQVLDCLNLGSSMCYKDIDELADNAIVRMDDYGYHLRDIENRTLVFLIYGLFNILKKINHGNPPTEKMLLIHRDFNKYMYGVESPVVSPVPSPEVTPKIMKKENGKKKRFFQ
jgi:hypothetical protein